VGLFSYKKVVHPVRTTRRAAVRAVTPKPVRKARRAAITVRHPASSLEGAAKASLSRSVSGRRSGRGSSGRRSPSRSAGSSESGAHALVTLLIVLVIVVFGPLYLIGRTLVRAARRRSGGRTRTHWTTILLVYGSALVALIAASHLPLMRAAIGGVDLLILAGAVVLHLRLRKEVVASDSVAVRVGPSDEQRTGVDASSAPDADEERAPAHDTAQVADLRADIEPEAAVTTQAEPPVVLEGEGWQVREIELPLDHPVVAWAEYDGDGLFSAWAVALTGDERLLFSQVGRFRSETVWAKAAAGRHRVKVEADGSWRLGLQQPLPTGDAARLPGSFTGSGKRVLPVRADESFQAVVDATAGEGLFSVSLIGYGPLIGVEHPLFSVVGSFRGQTLVNQLRNGPYLLMVESEGAWSIGFRV
jgi:hypothetical protein